MTSVNLDVDTSIVTTPTYQVRVENDPPRAIVELPGGGPLTEVSLIAQLDRSDCVDETFGWGTPSLRAVSEGEIEVLFTSQSTAWNRKELTLRCLPDRMELVVVAFGEGRLGRVRLMGGQAVSANGSAGIFRSQSRHASVFVPSPSEPVRFVRPAETSAAVGILGDAQAGRLHAVFAPPPMCFVLGSGEATGPLDIPAGSWLSLGLVAPVEQLRFTEMRYDALDDGYLLELDYDGRTTVQGQHSTPTLVITPVEDPWEGLARYRDHHLEHGWAPSGIPAQAQTWWNEPLFCGWGVQCGRVAEAVEAAGESLDIDPQGEVLGALDQCTSEVYDAALGRLAEQNIVPGTVIIDDGWASAYGTGEVHTGRWPDLRAWIADRHSRGQRVVLWWKVWDPQGLPVEECLVDPRGVPLYADPASLAYLARVDRVVAELLGPEGLNADGLKLDFSQRGPTGLVPRPARPDADPSDEPWGISALHSLLRRFHQAAHQVKPDAMIIAHAPHPVFADTSDVVRLNDVLDRDVNGRPVSGAQQAAVRAAIVRAVLPSHLIDTDQWPMRDLDDWREYVQVQDTWGVPALYYVDRMDRSPERISDGDLALVARSWERSRDRFTLGEDLISQAPFESASEDQ